MRTEVEFINLKKRTGIFRSTIAWLAQFSLFAIIVGAIAMTATFPGRTHGLGQYTESILADLGLNSEAGRVTYSVMGFWATIFGSLFCLPIGWLLERFGQRTVLILNLLLLGASVIILSQAYNSITLVMGFFLTRGFGQSALSVVSITIVSNSHQRSQLGMAMALYTILFVPFHVVLIQLVGWGLNTQDFSWRTVMGASGIVIASLFVAAFAIPKRSIFGGTSGCVDVAETTGLSWTSAVKSEAFWVFAVTISSLGMISAGVSLFNEDILRERGFDSVTYTNLISYSALIGLFSKFLLGWLHQILAIKWLLFFTTILSSFSLVCLPLATEIWHVYIYGTITGVAGAGVAILFFSCWGIMFGHRDIGKIQSIAQMMTVLASATGPVLFALVKAGTHSYSMVFFAMAIIVFVLGIWALRLHPPMDQFTK